MLIFLINSSHSGLAVGIAPASGKVSVNLKVLVLVAVVVLEECDPGWALTAARAIEASKKSC